MADQEAMDNQGIMQTMLKLQESASVQQVVGEAKTVGDKTIIPLAAVQSSYGFGWGGGPATAQGESEQASATGRAGGAGGGGRATARPVAVVEIGPEGTRVRPIIDTTRLALAGMLLTAWVTYWGMATGRATAKYMQKK